MGETQRASVTQRPDLSLRQARALVFWAMGGLAWRQ